MLRRDKNAVGHQAEVFHDGGEEDTNRTGEEKGERTGSKQLSDQRLRSAIKE